jgi:hypothetical protein
MAIFSVGDEVLTTRLILRSLWSDTMAVGATLDQVCMSSAVSDRRPVRLVLFAFVVVYIVGYGESCYGSLD